MPSQPMKSNFQPFVSVGRNDGSEPVFNEITVLDWLVRLFKHITKWEFYSSKIGFQQRHIGGRQARENTIFGG